MTSKECAGRGQVSSIIVDAVEGEGLFTIRGRGTYLHTNEYLIIYFFNKLVVNLGDGWTHHRKCLNPTMHYTIINSYYPVFNRCIKKLIDQLNEQVNQPHFDIYDYLDKCTLTMICESLLGIEVDLETQTEFNILNAVNLYVKK